MQNNRRWLLVMRNILRRRDLRHGQLEGDLRHSQLEGVARLYGVGSRASQGYMGSWRCKHLLQLKTWRYTFPEPVLRVS